MLKVDTRKFFHALDNAKTPIKKNPARIASESRNRRFCDAELPKICSMGSFPLNWESPRQLVKVNKREVEK